MDEFRNFIIEEFQLVVVSFAAIFLDICIYLQLHAMFVPSRSLTCPGLSRNCCPRTKLLGRKRRDISVSRARRTGFSCSRLDATVPQVELLRFELPGCIADCMAVCVSYIPSP